MRGDKRYSLENGNEESVEARGYYGSSYFVLPFDHLYYHSMHTYIEKKMY